MKAKKLSFLLASIVLMFVMLVGCGGGKNPENYTYTTPKTDALKLEKTWEGKDFLKDGIGEVKLVTNVDGDTTIVSVPGYSGTITLRYLGVDTPESTYRVEPWGFAASDFTKGKLKNAKTIVVESDPLTTVKDGNGRYLAWVWYRNSETEDFRLLNLELVENAFSASKGTSLSYEDTFLGADYAVRDAGCRYWGQKDPNYDETKIGEIYTIKQIRENFETLNVAEQRQHSGKVVRVSGIVSKSSGVGSAYLQQKDPETGIYYGVYVYGGFTSSILKEGREVVVSGKIGYFNGGLQITDLDRNNTALVSLENEIHIAELTGEQYLNNGANIQGQLVKLTNLTVTGGYNTANSDGMATGSYTIDVEDENGNKIEIRVDKNTTIKITGENLVDGIETAITTWNYFEGRTITEITAVVGWFSNLNKDETAYKDDGIQLLLVSGNDIILAPAA